jgi:hypothetical protein
MLLAGRTSVHWRERESLDGGWWGVWQEGSPVGPDQHDREDCGMKVRADGCASNAKGILVGVRVASGAAIQFHTVNVKWEDVLTDDFLDNVDAYLRRRLRERWAQVLDEPLW